MLQGCGGNRALGRVEVPPATYGSPLNVPLDVLADGRLASPLADLSNVSTRKAMRELGEGLKVHIGGDGGFAEDGLKDLAGHKEGGMTK